MDILPKIKETVIGFLAGEEGKIAKEAVLSLGALFSASVIPTIATAAHTSVTQLEFEPPSVEKATHTSAHTSAPADCNTPTSCTPTSCTPTSCTPTSCTPTMCDDCSPSDCGICTSSCAICGMCSSGISFLNKFFTTESQT